MISYLTGTIEYISGDCVILDVGGIGYEVTISASTAQQLTAMDRREPVRVYTYMLVREDMIALYGFISRDDLELFKILITVSGIGPKGALSILSGMSSDDLRFAIVTGDTKAISRAPGIGKKTAERVILDLRDKISAQMENEDREFLQDGPLSGEDTTEAGTEHSEAADAVAALVALGYPRGEAARAVRRCREAGDTEAILKEALKFLL